MKKLFVKTKWIKNLLLILGFFLCKPDIQAQMPVPVEKRDSLIQARDALYQKGKQQKTAAWILMSGGSLLTIVGLAAASTSASLTAATLGQAESNSGGGALVVGLGVMVGSIPLFIAGNRNKDKALLMDLGLVPVSSPPGQKLPKWTKALGGAFDYIPGMTVTYQF